MSELTALEIQAEVLARARAGDSAAHEAIYRACVRPVHALVARLVTRPAVADEITQEVFVQILRSVESFAGQGPFGAWVRRIAISKCLMYLRSPWNRASLWLDTDSDADPASVALATNSMQADHLADDPAMGFAREEAALESALAQLAPLSRTVVWLHDVEGYTHAEIALELGRSVSFSKSQLARAHERLRRLLTQPQESMTCMPASSSC